MVTGMKVSMVCSIEEEKVGDRYGRHIQVGEREERDRERRNRGRRERKGREAGGRGKGVQGKGRYVCEKSGRQVQADRGGPSSGNTTVSILPWSLCEREEGAASCTVCPPPLSPSVKICWHKPEKGLGLFLFL